jgi:hypothetical protein
MRYKLRDRGDRLTSWSTWLDGLATFEYDNNGQLTSADHTQSDDETYA